MTTQQDKPLIRDATLEDADQLADIYNYYVENTAITFDVEPVTVENRQDWIRTFEPGGRYRLLVAQLQHQITGYVCSHRFRVKPAYATSIETTIYLHHEATGAGTGSLLYSALFDAVSREHIHRAYAGITLPNEASMALHQKFGFERVGTFEEVG